MKEISALPLFARVIELNSFAEAARQLNVPTTTVSRKIQQLEAELGGKLINRSTRSLSLTELGQQVLPKAQLIADTVSELYHEAEDAASKPIGTLNITAPRALSQNLLASLFAEFQTRYPTIKINLASSNRYQDMTKQSLDFAFRLGPLSDSSLVAISLSPVKYVLAISNALANALPKFEHPRQLNAAPCIRNHVEGYFLPWRFSLKDEVVEVTEAGSVTTDDFFVSKQLCLDGAGVCYLPKSMLYQELQTQQLTVILDDWVPQDKTMLLVYQDRKHLPQKSQLFIDFIREKKSYIEAFLSGQN